MPDQALERSLRIDTSYASVKDMDFEPAVLRSIKRNRKEVRRSHLLARAPLLACLAAATAILLWRWVSFLKNRAGQENPLPVLFGANSSVLIAVGLFAFIVVFVVIGFLYRRMVLPLSRQYDSIISSSKDYPADEYTKFENALEGACIGMGIPTPPLDVIGMPTPNCVSVVREGRQVVCVTEDALRAGVSTDVADAMMAHELSHVLAGDTLRPPAPSIGMMVFLGAIACFVSVIFYMLIGPTIVDIGQSPLYALIPPALGLVAMWLYLDLSIRPHSLSAMRQVHAREDILADSIAVKLTRHPDGMRRAIEEIARGVKSSPEMPSETMCFTQLFVGPLNKWRHDPETAVPEASEITLSAIRQELRLWRKKKGIRNRSARGALVPLSPDEIGRKGNAMANRAGAMMESFMEWQRELIVARKRNLDLIDRDLWQMFESPGGERHEKAP